MYRYNQEVLIEEDNGNILSFGTVIDINEIMIQVQITSGMLEGYTRWFEVDQISPRPSI